MQNKIVNIPIVLKINDIKIIEKRILNYSTGPEIIGYKIQNKYGNIWLNKNQFEVLFREWENLF